ncbi:MAG: hypothetical protein M3Q48_11975 [Actinomycetota bacterium]|nr:hypothetical protein [Actinomycetota bacterium]
MEQPLFFRPAHEPDEIVVECRHRPPGTRLEVIGFVGTSLFDVVPTTSAREPPLVSPRLIQVLSDLGATGWRGDSIQFTDHVLARVPALVHYVALIVDGSAGPLRMNRSGAELTKEMLWSDEEVQFDWDSWDGSDVFQAGQFGVFVVPRVAEALAEAGLTNLRLSTVDDMVATWREIFPRKRSGGRHLP